MVSGFVEKDLRIGKKIAKKLPKKGDFRAKIYQKFRWDSVIHFLAMSQKLHLPSNVAAGSI